MTSYYAIVWIKLFLDGRNNDYRKIPKISNFMYKPLQILASQTSNVENPSLNRPSKYKHPGGL